MAVAPPAPVVRLAREAAAAAAMAGKAEASAPATAARRMWDEPTADVQTAEVRRARQAQVVRPAQAAQPERVGRRVLLPQAGAQVG